jgi:hypothetical protein
MNTKQSNSTSGGAKRPLCNKEDLEFGKKSKSMPIRDSWSSLDEENVELDRLWLQDKAEYTDKKNKNSTVCYPTWSIIGRKYTGIEYQFSTGDINIIFRQYGEKPAYLKLDLFEWAAFCEKFSLIQKLIHVVEGKRADITPEDLFNGESIMEFQEWKTVFYILNTTLRLCIKWNTATKSVLVIISRGFEERVPRKKYPKFNTKPEDGLLLGATGMDYLIRFLENRIINGIQLWSNIRKIGNISWNGCFLLPENNTAKDHKFFQQPTDKSSDEEEEDDEAILTQALEDAINIG